MGDGADGGGGSGGGSGGGGGGGGGAGAGGAPQLVIYSTLLQTKKLFLCGCMLAPALASTLLCASRVDTNASCNRLLIDNWLLIEAGNKGGSSGVSLLRLPLLVPGQ